MSCERFNDTNILMIAGNEECFEFNITDLIFPEELLNVEKFKWRLSKYGEKEVLKTIETDVTEESEEYVCSNPLFSFDGHVVYLIVPHNITSDLSGRFTHQLIVIGTNNRQFVLDLGFLTIKSLIQ